MELRSLRRGGTLPALLLVLAAACGAPQDHTPTIRPWLTCGDCTDGELEAVVALGTDAVPDLVRALDGPSSAVVDSARVGFEQHWDRTARYLLGEGTRPSQDRFTFLDIQESNFTWSYRRRAVDALGAIGGGAARRALVTARRRAASDPTTRPSFLAAIDRAIDAIDGR